MAQGKVRVRLFAGLREAASVADLELELAGEEPVSQLWERLCQVHPQLQSWRESVKPARNLVYVSWDAPVAAGDELAFLPPVSGGAPTEEPLIEVGVGPEPIDIGEMGKRVERRGIGAIATFDGLVRDPDQGRQVGELKYEAYPEMAEPVLAQICAEACHQFGASEARVQHRTGTVARGVTSVAVVVGAAHRHQALSACQYIIDELKSRAPIWKSSG